MAKKRRRNLTPEQKDALKEVAQAHGVDLKAVKFAKAHPLLHGRENSRTNGAWKTLLQRARDAMNGHTPQPRVKKEIANPTIDEMLDKKIPHKELPHVHDSKRIPVTGYILDGYAYLTYTIKVKLQ